MELEFEAVKRAKLGDDHRWLKEMRRFFSQNRTRRKSQGRKQTKKGQGRKRFS